MFKTFIISLSILCCISLISCETEDKNPVNSDIENQDPGDTSGDGNGNGDGNTNPEFGYAFFFTQIERPCQGAPIMPVGWIRIRVQGPTTGISDVGLMQVFDSSIHTVCQSGGGRLNQLNPGTYFYEASCELGGWDPRWSGTFTIFENQCTPIQII